MPIPPASRRHCMAGKLGAQRNVLIGTSRTRSVFRGNASFVFGGALLRYAEAKSASGLLETSKWVRVALHRRLEAPAACVVHQLRSGVCNSSSGSDVTGSVGIHTTEFVPLHVLSRSFNSNVDANRRVDTTLQTSFVLYRRRIYTHTSFRPLLLYNKLIASILRTHRGSARRQSLSPWSSSDPQEYPPAPSRRQTPA